jgi:hypothetical protein
MQWCSSGLRPNRRRVARLGSLARQWCTGRGECYCAEGHGLRPRQGHCPCRPRQAAERWCSRGWTFFIGRCRSTRTLSLKDRRDGLRIQRTHRRASTPKVRRKKARPQLRYRPLMPSWRMGRSTRLRIDFATQPDVAASWARSRRRAGAPQKQRGVDYRATAFGAKYPMVGSFAGCCASAASGQAAAPPSNVVNSRRLLTRSPRRQARAACLEWQCRLPWRC